MTSGNKLSRIIAVFLCAVLSFSIASFVMPAATVNAAGGHWEGAYNEGNPDEQIVQIGLYDYQKHAKLTITIDITKNEFDIAKVSGCSKNLVSSSSGEIKIKNFEYTKPVTIKITIRGTNVNATTVRKASVSAKNPTAVPTNNPTKTPTKNPTKAPTTNPTKTPTKNPTKAPTTNPTKTPTKNPTKTPTKNPTKTPTKNPTKTPTTKPTTAPTTKPTTKPTTQSSTQGSTKQNSDNKKDTKKKTAKKTAAEKKAAAGKTNSVKKKVNSSTAAGDTSETTTVFVAAVDNKIDTTTTSEETEPTEETAPEAALNHSEWHRRSFAWLWFVLALVAVGLSYLRIRKLKNEGKTGKDLALDFIPGVGDLVYAISGSNTKYEPIASDAQRGYSYNPAAGKKEIKAIDEEAERAAKSAFKPASTQHTPIKRPKELSVNRAAALAAAAGATGGKEMQEEAAEQKPATAAPFKPAEGITRARSVDPNEVFKTEVSHTTDEIMTSAFKPSLGSHTTDKIVTSAFKPVAGSHASDKIVSSAVKPTSKFTPQRSASTSVQQDSDAVRQARERAEAAREQQAMRAAMRTGRTVAEVKGEAKPAATGPVSRPSAFGTNRPAANASAAKSTFNPVAAPVRTKTGSTNSNQLGSMLAGKSNGAARTPVWASRGAAINPFKQAGETEAAEPAEEENKAMSSYGTAVSSSAIMQGDQHVTDTRYKAAKGRTLEGQRPAIADPSAHVAPTATQPVFGFKPIDPNSQNN